VSNYIGVKTIVYGNKMVA